MAVQVRLDNINVAFYLDDSALAELDVTLLQDAGRSVPLACGTVMTKVAASQKWVPLTDLAAVDGTSIPLGIYVGNDIAAADLVAGDVTDITMIVGRTVLDVAQLVLENSLTFDDIVTVGTTSLLTVKDYLAMLGIYLETTTAISAFEN